MIWVLLWLHTGWMIYLIVMAWDELRHVVEWRYALDMLLCVLLGPLSLVVMAWQRWRNR